MILVWNMGFAILSDYFYGKDSEKGFFLNLFLSMVVCIGGTFFVYRYFVKPTKRVTFAFFESPLSAKFGDIVLFLNTIGFQLIWNFGNKFEPSPITNFSDIFYRLLGFLMIFSFFYLPPRVLYLADDGNRKKAWFSILFANSPVAFRFIFG